MRDNAIGLAYIAGGGLLLTALVFALVHFVCPDLPERFSTLVYTIASVGGAAVGTRVWVERS